MQQEDGEVHRDTQLQHGGQCFGDVADPVSYTHLDVYKRQLQADGINSISSRELAAQMGTTASQVRQDFNCIGDVNGRQGIGY